MDLPAEVGGFRGGMRARVDDSERMSLGVGWRELRGGDFGVL